MQPDAPAPPADRPAMAAMSWRLTHVLALPLKAAASRIGVTTGEYLEWLAWEVRRRDSEEFA